MAEQDEIIDLDKQYFQRSTRRLARNRAIKRISEKYRGEDVAEHIVEAAILEAEEKIYSDVMKESALSDDIPLHVETTKTAETAAIRYRARPGVTTAAFVAALNPSDEDLRKQLENPEINPLADIVEERKCLVKESQALAMDGWLRSPSEAVQWAEKNAAHSIAAEPELDSQVQETERATNNAIESAEPVPVIGEDNEDDPHGLVSRMAERGLTPATLATRMGKKGAVIASWVKFGVPETFQRELEEALA